MSRYVVIAAVMALTISVTSGCGTGMISEQRTQPSSPAMQIDPFEFGDEFMSTPGGTQAETPTESGDSALETEPLTSTGETTPAPGSDQFLAPGSRTSYRIQLSGVFNSREEADRYANRARRQLDSEISVEFRAPFYRVLTGSFTSEQDADMYVRFLRQEGFNDARRVTVSGTAP